MHHYIVLATLFLLHSGVLGTRNLADSRRTPRTETALLSPCSERLKHLASEHANIYAASEHDCLYVFHGDESTLWQVSRPGYKEEKTTHQAGSAIIDLNGQEWAVIPAHRLPLKPIHETKWFKHQIYHGQLSKQPQAENRSEARKCLRFLSELYARISTIVPELLDSSNLGKGLLDYYPADFSFHNLRFSDDLSFIRLEEWSNLVKNDQEIVEWIVDRLAHHSEYPLNDSEEADGPMDPRLRLVMPKHLGVCYSEYLHLLHQNLPRAL